MTAERQLHLGLNVLATGMHPAAWRAPYSDPLGFVDPGQWQRVAELAEQGTLDAIFLADSPSILWAPVANPPLAYDPGVLLSGLATQTSHIGLVGTVSTSFDAPYSVARRFSSLDHLSRGRAGWNIVTGTDASAAKNFGSDDHLSREARYAKAEEFVDVVTHLWDSWDEDAIVADKATGLFADESRIHPIDHHGEFFHVEGPLTLPRTPQGRPVIVQAGGSPPGRELAARNADAIFCSLGTIKQAHAFSIDIKRRTAAHGRGPDAIRILPGLSLVLGGTEAEAHARNDELNELAGESRLQNFAWQIGVEPSDLDFDRPLPSWLLETKELSSAGSQGAREIVTEIARAEPRLTVRELLDRVITWHRLIVGTPEQVADSIEEWWRSGAVDGFNLMPDVFPSGLEAFVEQVVPILRKRGLFRHEYTGTTLRHHLGLERPVSRYDRGAAELVA
jgi:FMN-dependent oxidoreductase (nitrilotriacetate monooxygenase family)